MAITFETTTNIFTLFIFLTSISLFYFPIQELKKMEESKQCYEMFDRLYSCIEESNTGYCSSYLGGSLKVKDSVGICKDNYFVVMINDVNLTGNLIECYEGKQCRVI